MPNNYDPNLGLRKFFDPVRVNVKDGQLKKNRVGYIPAPFTVDELQRLLLVYFHGDAAWSSAPRYYPAKVDDVDYPGTDVISANPNDDDIIHRVRAKMTDIVFATEIKGGTVFFDEICPDVELVSVTQARADEAAQDPETAIDFCLPEIPTGETEDQQAEREEREGLERWVYIHISKAELDALIADWMARHAGSGAGGSTYGIDGGNSPGTGDGSNLGPGTGFPDTGVGGSDFTSSPPDYLKVCFDPPILLDGPHLEDVILSIAPGSGILPQQHTADVTQKIHDAFHKAYGQWGKLFRFKACELSFDGLEVTRVHYFFPVDVTIPVLFPLNPKILWTDGLGSQHLDLAPNYTGLTAHVKGKVGGAETNLVDFDVDEFDEVGGTIGLPYAVPNSGHFIRCSTIGTGYLMETVPPYAEMDEATPAHHDHNGFRWFLECLYCHFPTEYEVTMPFTSTANTPSHDALTTGVASGTYPSNGWEPGNLLDYGGGFKAWYCTTNAGHYQVFLPEGKTCTKIIFDVTIANPDGVTDADWDCRVSGDEAYGSGSFGPVGCPTQHNHSSGSHTDTSTHHIEVTLPATYDSCVPFHVQVFGGVILLEATISYS